MGKVIELDHIAKIEGHAALHIKVDKGKVESVNMKVLEGARYFEGILLGKHHTDVPSIVSRICGFCSQIHQMTGLKAIERAMDIEVSEYVEDLRETIILGSVLQSHALHLLFFAMPDYVGHESAISMAREYPDYVKKALQLKVLSDNVCRTIGGRAIHTLTPTVGGMNKFPTEKDAASLISDLEASKEKALWLAGLFDDIDYPDFSRDTDYAALVGNAYPFLRGKVRSSFGEEFTDFQYSQFIEEKLVEGETAKRGYWKGKDFMVGALARMNLNQGQLSDSARGFLKRAKTKFPSASPYHNNVAQAVENVHVIDRMISILGKVDGHSEPVLKAGRMDGRGIAITEAPRGSLIHDYTVNQKGRVESARIITPTIQNLTSIEKDVAAFLPSVLGKKEAEIKLELEKLIRAYDPCISCSAHFLKLVWE